MSRFRRNGIISDSEDESYLDETCEESVIDDADTSMRASSPVYDSSGHQSKIALQQNKSGLPSDDDLTEDESYTVGDTPRRNMENSINVDESLNSVVLTDDESDDERSNKENILNPKTNKSNVSTDEKRSSSCKKDSTYCEDSELDQSIYKGNSAQPVKKVLTTSSLLKNKLYSFPTSMETSPISNRWPSNKKQPAVSALLSTAMETSPICIKTPKGELCNVEESIHTYSVPVLHHRKQHVISSAHATAMDISPMVDGKSPIRRTAQGDDYDLSPVSSRKSGANDRKGRTVPESDGDSDEQADISMISSFDSASEHEVSLNAIPGRTHNLVPEQPDPDDSDNEVDATMSSCTSDQEKSPPNRSNKPTNTAPQHQKPRQLSEAPPTAMDVSPYVKKTGKTAANADALNVTCEAFEDGFHNPRACSTLIPSDFEQKPSEVTKAKMLPIPMHLLGQIQKHQTKVTNDPESIILIDDSSSGVSTDSDDIVAATSSEGSSTQSPKKKDGPSDSINVIYESPSSGISFPEDGSYAASTINGSSDSEKSGHSSYSNSQLELQFLKKQMEEKTLALRNLSFALKSTVTSKLKDGGKLLVEKKERCQRELEELRKKYEELMHRNSSDDVEVIEVKKDNNIIFSTRDQNIGDMGKKALETHRIEKALTMDALVNLHSGLATTPSADVLEEQPDGLSAKLMQHQKQALAWLLHREKQTPAGGILADDMGLGKTLTMISLVLKSKEMRKNDEDGNSKSGWKLVAPGPGHPGKTLVVCPASLLSQWEGQVSAHVQRGRLRTQLHHGTNREGRGRELTGADIVITTYGVLSQENKTKGALFRVAWERVILDEAHTIRNHKTQVAVAASEISAKYRWCLTGTPVHNKELDMYSLLKFLKCEPFDDIAVWKRWVDNKSAAGTERLNTVVKAILLRRTKEELKTAGKLQGALSTKQIHEIRVTLDRPELQAYQCVMNFSMTLVAQYLQQRSEKIGGALTVDGITKIKSQLRGGVDVKTHEILVLLLRLRQICSLPGLITAMLEEGDAAIDGFEKEDKVVEDLFKQVRRLTISAPPPPPDEFVPDQLDAQKILITSNPVFAMDRTSSKMQHVINIVQSIVETGEKVVVVSQWALFLRIMERHLQKLRVKMATLDGSVPVKSRGPLIEEFNSGRTMILLLSLTAGGVGLNLVGGNHLIVMEPHWNPQLESQACDRIYRVGQSKPVHIYKVICNETIEERIETLQKKKLALADSILSGQMKKEATKLSLQDIKSLFGLDPSSSSGGSNR